ncbi:hypothetical protein [Lysobacter niastensis]|uniref:Secreted protein n=1 Tax=Lysobacter niastensis TaxID=380629 RepID=A0ABS0BCI5_9GAMM|nr:hypothetical protein [Lysobacter niastensis]MBF6025657.1 hypothetical protein [Lysobacter niastensis]
MPKRSRITALSLALFAAAVQMPAMAEKPYVALEKRLSAEQLHATGLDTLSTEQLALLNRLLSDEQVARDTQKARDSAGLREKRDAATESFTATVKGDSRGWSTGDVVTLDNGQRWRVIDGELYLGKSVSQPKVTVSPGAFGSWYLQVEGQTPKLKVQRVP